MTKLRLPDLPYALDALAPHVSPETMELHWGKHHRGYVDSINRLVAGTPLEGAGLDEVLARGTGALANAAAQASNHAFLWRSMTPRRTTPTGALAAAVDESFGSRGALQVKLKEAGLALFGSGWVWLVRKRGGLLDVVATPNAGLRVHDEHLYPLLVCDVWEHAYYLDYKNDRGRYLDAMVELLDWQRASQRYSLADGRRLTRTRTGTRTASAASDEREQAMKAVH